MSTETHLKQNYIGGRWVDSKGGKPHDVINPATEEAASTIVLGTAADVDDAVAAARAAHGNWSLAGGAFRAERLERAADLLEEHDALFLGLAIDEAGKTLVDAIAEVREAVDFLRYYAQGARQQFGAPTILPGPTGEENSLALHGRGVFATISPWNFPLAIFIGMASAALAAGNTVIAKPAEQTPLIAALAVKLCHEAGIPPEALQLLPGAGAVGQMITADPRLAGVAFTGSTATARAINRCALTEGTPSRLATSACRKPPT